MKVGLISARFSRALFDFSAIAGEEKLVHEELSMVLEQLRLVPQFSETLLSPVVSAEAKLNLMLTAVGRKASASLTRFFRLLLDHRREALLQFICQSFMRLYDKEKGIVKVRLITAVPLEEKRRKDILLMIERSSGKTIELTMAVQPDIIGGYILMTDEKRLDASVKTRLMNIREQLMI